MWSVVERKLHILENMWCLQLDHWSFQLLHGSLAQAIVLRWLVSSTISQHASAERKSDKGRQVFLLLFLWFFLCRQSIVWPSDCSFIVNIGWLKRMCAYLTLGFISVMFYRRDQFGYWMSEMFGNFSHFCWCCESKLVSRVNWEAAKHKVKQQKRHFAFFWTLFLPLAAVCALDACQLCELSSVILSKPRQTEL